MTKLGTTATIAIALASLAWMSRGCSEKGPLRLGALSRTKSGAIEIVEAPLWRGHEESGRMIALYFDANEVKPSLALNERSLDLEDLAKDALAVANAGFFTPERRATGLLVSGGRVLSPFVREGGGAGSGVFVLEGGKPELFQREKFDRKTFEGVELAIQAGPRVIEPGGTAGIKSDDGERANRTLIGRDTSGRMIVAVLLGPSGWQSGPTLFEAQKILAEKELAFELALNLDGGPSTGLHVRAKDRRIDFAESAPVHSVLSLGAKQ